MKILNARRGCGHYRENIRGRAPTAAYAGGAA